MCDKIIYLTDGSFDKEVLQPNRPFLVDFWAEWCGPCKVISSILSEIADEFDGKLSIAKLNVDQNPATALKYGIRNLPTLLLFSDSKLIATKVGALSKGQLKEFINTNL